MATDNMIKRPIVYIGRRMLRSDKEGVAFITTERLAEIIASAEFINQGGYAVDHIDRHASFYNKPKRNIWAVGGIYSADCETDETGKIIMMRFGNLEFVKMHESDMLAGWRAADNAVATEKAKRSAEKRAKGNTRLDAAIATIAYHYQNVAFKDRRGFEFWLLDQLKAKH